VRAGKVNVGTTTALFVAVILLSAAGRSPEQRSVGIGVVEGTVTLHLPAPRRSASRYPGGSARPHPVQPVPAVVFIKGPVAGSPTRTGNATATLAQKDTAFAPAAMLVQVGTTVRFPNEDAFFHNVFSYSGAARFDLGRYPRGEAKDVQFDEPGIVKVYCEVHEFMRAVIVVTENPFHAVVGEDGRFRLDGVPAGTHTLVVWHPDLDEVEQTVVVSEREAVQVNVELR
jgi:plastocyanin